MSSSIRGTYTFMFTDVVGSTERWERDPESTRADIRWQEDIITSCVTEHGGAVFKTVGDAVCASFLSARGALLAAQEAQTALRAAEWTSHEPIEVRIGIASGEAEHRNGDYFGQVLNRVARIEGVAVASQVLVSSTTVDILERGETDIQLVDLGEIRLKGIGSPQRIFALDYPGMPRNLTVPRLQPPSHHNLPANHTSFVGRSKELADLEKILRANRLITIVGPGGTGKTRIAVELAHRLIPRYEDGVFFVELADIDDPEVVPAIVASAIGLKPHPGSDQIAATARAIEGQQMLLVIDNFEHVHSEAPLVTRILEASEHVDIVVTSRSSLGLGPEVLYSLAPLSGDAVALFGDRAASIRPSFEITERNRDAVTRICELLDWLPLAVEIAASRTRFMQPEQILNHIREDRAAFIARETDRPDRQRSTWDAVDWSYRLLSDDERRCFALAATIEGSAPSDDFASVFGLVVSEPDVMLESLVDKSMLSVVESDTEMRFRMLKTIRSYAQQRLDEFAGLRETSVRSYLRSVARRLSGGAGTLEEWMAGTRKEKLTISGGPPAEDVAAYRAVLRGLPDIDPEESIHFISVVGGALWDSPLLFDVVAAADILMSRDLTGLSSAAAARAVAPGYYLVKRYEQAYEATRDAHEFALAAGYRRVANQLAGNLSVILEPLGRSEEATVILREALAESSSQEWWNAAWSHAHNLAQRIRRSGDHQEAIKLEQQAIAFARKSDQPIYAYYCMHDRALTEMDMNLMVTAATTLLESSEAFVEPEFAVFRGAWINVASTWAARAGFPAEGILWYGGHRGQMDREGTDHTPSGQLQADETLGLARAALGESETDRLLAEAKASNKTAAFFAARRFLQEYLDA